MTNHDSTNRQCLFGYGTPCVCPTRKQVATDLLELFKESVERGETSLDIAMRMHGVLKDVNPKLLKKFARFYEQFSNDDIDELPDGLVTDIENQLKNIIDRS